MKNLFSSLFLLVITNSFAQEITGHVRTEDKYSVVVKSTITEYLENKYTTFDKVYADDVAFFFGDFNIAEE